ncbi:MAG: winged helix-turn-helix domain-containing protein [Acidobacteriota bacterium]|nr:winged helix-turn-helix domain-containing protein [Acidobacteriota bacterium]
MNDTALAALQRSLTENREAKRKIQARVAEIEAESASLRSQINSLDTIIEQTEHVLLQMLFPALQQQAPAPSSNLHSSPHAAHPIFRQSFRSRETNAETDIDAEVARLTQSEKSSNVRFTDFRIPQAASIVLREANGPLHVSELYRRLSDGGFEFRGQHQLITLAVSLSRSKRFRKVAPGTFDLNPDYMAGQVA